MKKVIGFVTGLFLAFTSWGQYAPNPQATVSAATQSLANTSVPNVYTSSNTFASVYANALYSGEGNVMTNIKPGGITGTTSLYFKTKSAILFGPNTSGRTTLVGDSTAAAGTMLVNGTNHSESVLAPAIYLCGTANTKNSNGVDISINTLMNNFGSQNAAVRFISSSDSYDDPFLTFNTNGVWFHTTPLFTNVTGTIVPCEASSWGGMLDRYPTGALDNAYLSGPFNKASTITNISTYSDSGTLVGDVLVHYWSNRTYSLVYTGMTWTAAASSFPCVISVPADSTIGFRITNGIGTNVYGTLRYSTP